MTELWTLLRDPRVTTSVVLGALVLAGFGLVALAWEGAAATLFVALQLPYVLSGACVGLGLVVAGAVLLCTHVDRAEAAQERKEVAALQRDVLRLLASATTREHPGS